MSEHDSILVARRVKRLKVFRSARKLPPPPPKKYSGEQLATREDAKYNALYKNSWIPYIPENHSELTGASLLEQGWPMADDECDHGRCAGDSTPKCGCFPGE